MRKIPRHTRKAAGGQAKACPTKCGHCGADALKMGFISEFTVRQKFVLVDGKIWPVEIPQGDPRGIVLCLSCQHPLMADVDTMMRSL